MLRKCIIISIIFCLPIISILAQNTPQWRITLFNPETATVHYLTPDGLETGISFPQMLGMDFEQVVQMQVSPDDRFIAFLTYQSNALSVFVADLVNGTCCQQLVDPLNPMLDVVILGPFSPDSTQLATAMTSNSRLRDGSPVTGMVTVFDVVSGAPVNSLEVTKLAQPDATAAMDTWQDDGIRLISSCWGCEGIWEGKYQIWNPEMGTLSQPVESFDIFKTELPATGELIRASRNLDYPESGMPEVYFPPANVIEYFGDNEQTAGQVIYYNPTDHYIYQAQWVADGNAILVTQGGQLQPVPGQFPQVSASASYVLFRDGRLVELDPKLGDVFSTMGTPDGWITQIDDGIFHHRVEGAQVITTRLTAETGLMIIGSDFILGEDVSGAFRTVPSPAQTTCPGFITSRLAVNTIGRVLPGDANNFRSAPGTSSDSIGQIPGEAMFVVVAGPECADNLAWWQVNYDGQVGWTAEGQGEAYWLEPLTSGG